MKGTMFSIPITPGIGQNVINSLSQWLTFKLLGITYLVGKVKFNFLRHGPLAE